MISEPSILGASECQLNCYVAFLTENDPPGFGLVPIRVDGRTVEVVLL